MCLGSLNLTLIAIAYDVTALQWGQIYGVTSAASHFQLPMESTFSSDKIQIRFYDIVNARISAFIGVSGVTEGGACLVRYHFHFNLFSSFSNILERTIHLSEQH